MSMNSRSRAQSGFTLIEVIIFIVVVSVALAGVLLVIDTVVRTSADPMVRKQALALADSVLEEILNKNYEDPDGLPNVVESGRATFDDVDDYNGQTQAAFADLPPQIAARYTIGIVVNPPAPLNGVNAKRIVVTVTQVGSGEAISMTGYRGNY